MVIKFYFPSGDVQEMYLCTYVLSLLFFGNFKLTFHFWGVPALTSSKDKKVAFSVSRVLWGWNCYIYRIWKYVTETQTEKCNRRKNINWSGVPKLQIFLHPFSYTMIRTENKLPKTTKTYLLCSWYHKRLYLFGGSNNTASILPLILCPTE